MTLKFEHARLLLSNNQACLAAGRSLTARAGDTTIVLLSFGGGGLLLLKLGQPLSPRTNANKIRCHDLFFADLLRIKGAKPC